MDLKAILLARSDNQCELCGSEKELDIYQIEPAELAVSECQIITCSHCRKQLEGEQDLLSDHWHCLEKASTSDYTSVQVVSWRVLKVLSIKESWAADLLNTFNFDDLTLEWAQAGLSTAKV